MLWVKAFHVIFMVTWFSGLFYLPRLFVYHAMAADKIGQDRFKLMARKLYYGIMAPGAILTLGSGAWLLSLSFAGYLHQGWMQLKLATVLVTCLYHVYLGHCLRQFKEDNNTHKHVYYRWLNEVPVLFLCVIICMVIVKPHIW